MVRSIVKYGDPILRKKCARVEEITPAIVQLATDMLETTVANRLVGLAAPQVGEAIHMMVLDFTHSRRPSTLTQSGKQIPVESIMPLVLLNAAVEGEPEIIADYEFCGSLPGIKATIPRSATARVMGRTLEGEHIEFKAGGLLARVVQHEVDHLDGILFIDRMSAADLLVIQEQLRAIEQDTVASLGHDGESLEARSVARSREPRG